MSYALAVDAMDQSFCELSLVEQESGLARNPEVADTVEVVLLAGPSVRLSRKRLAQLSSFFDEVFAPSAAQNEVAGCPVFIVDDTRFDFQQFIAYIYCPVEPAVNECHDFSIIAALLRMCFKYRMHRPLADAKNRLRAMFPHTLEDWSAWDRILPFKPVRYHLAFEALNSVRLLGDSVVDILPAVLYHCALFDADIIRQGAPRIDGTLEKLTEEDIKLVLAAQGIIMEHAVKLTMDIIECDTFHGPRRFRRALTSQEHAGLVWCADTFATLLTNDPLHWSMVYVADYAYGGQWRPELKPTVEQWQNDLWDRLVRLARGEARSTQYLLDPGV
ncbi:hypothetical protein OH76DRAFT_94343 [Lentinus brumalis]|uniref:BTB domain-containing protein n=1 Tax=Lentinus brumalis TaxID=2498619 RepID=A0A371CQM6_9APHY|nr:hypothetical protein OH76DRAFT_94343 [Polyporus brumalis]